MGGVFWDVKFIRPILPPPKTFKENTMKTKNKNLNQVRKTMKHYSPTDRLENRFKKHSSNYKKSMEKTWGKK